MGSKCASEPVRVPGCMLNTSSDHHARAHSGWGLETRVQVVFLVYFEGIL